MHRIPGPIVARTVAMVLLTLVLALGAVWASVLLPRPRSDGQWVLVVGAVVLAVTGLAWLVFRVLPTPGGKDGGN